MKYLPKLGFMNAYGNIRNRNSVYKRTSHKAAVLNGHIIVLTELMSRLADKILEPTSCRANTIYLGAVSGMRRISFNEDDIDRQRINWLVGCGL
jgi:hypothetical protein